MSDERPTSHSDVIEDYDSFIEYFNCEVANTAIKCIKVISKERKRLLDARVKEYGKEAVANVIKKAVASNFLNGSAKENFVATFDWLIRPRNFLKTLEGNYDNRECVINKSLPINYDTNLRNGYSSREEIINGAANIICELRAEAQEPAEEEQKSVQAVRQHRSELSQCYSERQGRLCSLRASDQHRSCLRRSCP